MSTWAPATLDDSHKGMLENKVVAVLHFFLVISQVPVFWFLSFFEEG